ncbi:hypothetical protein [Pedobacter aquatilis]|uniref:tetratricopeptide repeat protein n=1 Tax=Pedobacter aquatilis TaxID=351343 RepID=UPI00292FCFAD|nr:hypothetical protein [Pedobacter aquatilis]
MKPSLLIVICLLLCGITSAQTTKQVKKAEKPPTQDEFQKMMKSLQSEMENLNPETKRSMAEMGIKMPDINATTKKLSGISDAQLKKEWENQSRIVPLRNQARIASIQPKLATAAIGSYISSNQQKLFNALKPQVKTLGESIFKALKASGKSNAAIGNAASALWLTGRIQTAIYLMSKTCAENPNNTDNLSNYAAMLSMIGAEEQAIPLLNNLNGRFPRNTTLLNNLGQAWFGLGDMEKSSKYLDSTLRIMGGHPQATVTKAKIEESKGGKTEAVNLVKKSIKTIYSQEKEEQLRKLGYDLGGNDLFLPANKKPDAMNLGGLQPPPFPKSVKECVGYAKAWVDFDMTLSENTKKLEKQQAEAKKLVFETNDTKLKAIVNQVQTGYKTGKFQAPGFTRPLHAAVAIKKLKSLEEDYFRKIKAWGEKISAFSAGRGEQLQTAYTQLMTKLQQEDAKQTGEGQRNENYCPKYQKASDDYLKAMNTELEQFYLEKMQLDKQYYNETAYLSMYMMSPEEFEAVKPALKMAWLKTLENHMFKSITSYMCIAEPEIKPSGKLAEFDDVACQYHSSMNYVIGTISVDCSRMETTLDLDFIKLGLKQNMDKETFEDQFVNCTVAVSANVGADIAGVGPLKAGVGAGVTGIIEIDRTGITDVVIEGSVGVSAGTNVIGSASKSLGSDAELGGKGISDASVNVGANGRISLITGASSIGFGTGVGGGLK